MPNTPYVDFKAVKTSVSILQILDHYGLTERFKRSGDSLSGSCPLHNGDNSTQFRVSASKNCWNCFGKCKRGGNVLDFVALKENISVREAAIRISEWFGLKFEKPVGRTDSRVAEKNPAAPPQNAPRSEPVGNNAAETGSNKPLSFQLQNLDSAHLYL